MVDVEQEKFIEHKQAPIGGHVAGFKECLDDKSHDYARITINQVRRIVAGAEWKTLAEIEPSSIQKYLRGLRKTGKIGNRTYNHYLEAIDTFLNWCVTNSRLQRNPLIGMERLNTEVDVRRKRRALTADELGLLVSSARTSGVDVQGFKGEQRARIYTLAYMTGLRKKELASLTPRSFNLKADPPTITVEAVFSKHRRKDVLPLHPELVIMLKEWLKGMAVSDKLFPKLAGRKTAVMVRQDLERVGITYETPEGVADFHAAGRHSHITELLRNGVTLPEAKELARHTDVKMTMRYTHIGMADQAKAVANLPAPRTKPTSTASELPAPDAALHGRCISSRVGCREVSTAGTSNDCDDGDIPFRRKGFGAGRRDVSPAGTTGAVGFIPAGSARTVNAGSKGASILPRRHAEKRVDPPDPLGFATQRRGSRCTKPDQPFDQGFFASFFLPFSASALRTLTWSTNGSVERTFASHLLSANLYGVGQSR
jgi:integrase